MTAEHMASCQNKKPCAPEQQKTVPTEIVTETFAALINVAVHRHIR